MNVRTRPNGSAHAPSFTFTMPTSIHEIFTEFVVQEIWSQLKKIAREDDVAGIANSVRSEASSDVRLYGHGSIKKKEISNAHRTPPSRTLILSIPLSLSRSHIRRDVKIW